MDSINFIYLFLSAVAVLAVYLMLDYWWVEIWNSGVMVVIKVAAKSFSMAFAWKKPWKNRMSLLKLSWESLKLLWK